MCSSEDHGESERRMMPAASSSRNSASALRSLSGSRRRALANTGRPVVLMVWRILCFGDGKGGCFGRRWLGTKLAGTVLTAIWSRGRRRTFSAAYRQRRAAWRAVSEFSSPAPGGGLGRPAARGRTRNLNLGWVCKRRRERRSQKTCAARMLSGGRHSASKEWPSRWRRRAAGRSATSGRTLQMVPVSTINYCLLSSSCRH